MNALGRQAAHHQRQHSDNFLESSSNGRWLQSAGLQHLQSSNNAIPPVQDFGYYNGGGQGSKMYKSFQAQRTYSGGGDLFAEPLTPPGNSRRKNGEEQVSPNECSRGLLDLHSFDTELLPEVDSDDVIEGSSRISLNCPISFKRIKIPVKGHLCKHLQCFDFDNYVDINSRRPSWRCPHCHQHVCFPEIRIDRKMVKVLQEVGPNVMLLLKV